MACTQEKWKKQSVELFAINTANREIFVKEKIGASDLIMKV